MFGLKFLCHRFPFSGKTQLVAMSATVGNLKELATFMKADLYTGNFRPVELREFVKVSVIENML